MYKHVDVGSWDFGVKTAEIIPVSSRGLTMSDGNAFFEKRAGSHEFRDVLDRMKLAKDEIPVHLIAMGSTESYGPNKNNDGFKTAMLKRDHPTFVSNAHVFYHHDNKDPKNAFGKVAASLFNDEMDRAELLVLLNGSKEAAEKNGGKVAPQEDVDLLNAGGELPWSMGIGVPSDLCENCKNAAPTVDDYCEEHECIHPETKKQRFGCKSGLGKTAEDGFVQYVDNPKGRFKDISRVSSPADRTAYGGKVDYASEKKAAFLIEKYAAAAGRSLGGAHLALARGYVDDEERLVKVAALQIYNTTLKKLAAVEATLLPAPEVLANAAGFSECDELPSQVAKFAASSTEQAKNEYLMRLADFDIVLSPKQFAKFAGYQVTEAYPSAVKGMFCRLDRAHDNRLGLLTKCAEYVAKKSRTHPAYVQLFKKANHYTPNGQWERIVSGTMSTKVGTTKVASSPTNTDVKAAVEYCLYKIAAISRMEGDIHLITACVQNF